VADSSRDVQPLAGSDAPPKTTPSGEKQGYSESAATDGTATTGVAATGATREVEGVTWGWPTSGKIQRGFSLPQSKGIDVDGTKGQKVLAAADGRVIYSGTMSGYGNLVIIKHNDDLLSAYANNSSNLVTQGAVVTRGQPVAEMGGSATASLHFEIRRQGKPDDPLKYLPKR
jgi:lipoprotein NlpD